MDFDVAVIGSGPAGVQAAIHAARKKVSVALIGKPANSAMAGTRIENYFGITETDGSKVLAHGVSQAVGFGARTFGMNCLGGHKEGDRFIVDLEDGSSVSAKALVLATGISRRKLGVPGEKELFGKGVSYCASCDCNFYKGRTVLIVGDETEAAVSAELMTRYASKTYWVSESVQASDAAKQRALDAGAVLIPAKVVRIAGGDRVENVELSDGSTVDTDGVFIELGARSSADLAMDFDVFPEMDDSVKVDAECRTQVPGIFACGDLTGRPWQVAKAVGQGNVAGMAAADYSKGVKE